MLIRAGRVGIVLTFTSVSLFWNVLHSQCQIIRECEAVLLSVQWMLLSCIVVWCGFFIVLDFSLKDLLLVGLLLIAITNYCVDVPVSSMAVDVTTLLMGITLGRGAKSLLIPQGRCRMWRSSQKSASKSSLCSIRSGAVGNRCSCCLAA